MNDSRFASRVALFVLALTCLATAAPAAEPRLENGLALVTDAVTLARSAEVDGGAVVDIPLVLTDADFAGVGAIQFGLQIDPRLTLVQVSFDSQVSVALEVAPGEWIAGFQNCVTHPTTPFTVATVRVLTPAGSNSDLTVDLRPLTAYGEPMAVTQCANDRFVEDVVDMGGVVLNPSGASIPFLAAAPPTAVVEGHSYQVGWTTIGASTVALDGEPVAAAGTNAYTAVTDRTFLLQASGSASDASLFVEVIREPRIDVFDIDVSTDFDPPRLRLVWDVVGTDVVTIDGLGEHPPRGTLLVGLDVADAFTLRAVNEFGEVTQTVNAPQLEDVPPTVLRFGAAPVQFGPGEPVTLTWSVFGADAVSIEPGVGSVEPRRGEVVVFPTEATTYTLTATNAFGTSTATTAVEPSPPIIEVFTVSPSQILQGESVQVTWSARNADTVRLEPDGLDLALEGSLELSPTEDTTYRLITTNAFGEDRRTRDVTVVVPEIFSFDIQPRQVAPGGFLTATWDVTPGVTLEIEPGVGPVSPATGSKSFVSVADGITYTLIGIVANQEVLFAEVGPIEWTRPIVDLQLLSSTVRPNVPFDLRVDCEACDGLEVIPAPGVIDPVLPRNDFSAVIDTATTFFAIAGNVAGGTIDTLVVEPEALPPVVSIDLQTIGADGTLFPGGSVRVTVEVSLASSARVEPGLGQIVNGTHVFDVAVEDSTVFEVIAENPYGRSRASVTAVPQAPFVSLEGSEAVFPGQEFELLLDVRGADAIFLEPIFGPVPAGGTFTSTLDSSTTFTARAINTAGESTAQWRVHLSPPIVDTFFATDRAVVLGESSELRWEVRGATQIELLGGDTVLASDLDPVGLLTVTPTETTTYTLRASNSTGEVTSTASVEVTPYLIRSFTALPRVVSPGGSTTLSWEAAGEGDLELMDFGPVEDVGTQIVVIDDDRTFTLIARVDGEEVDRATVQVEVVAIAPTLVGWSGSETDPDVKIAQPDIAVPFDLWISAQGLEGGILAFELGAVVPRVGIDLFLLAAGPAMPRGVTILGPPDWVVGTGECLFVDTLPLLKYTLLAVVDFGDVVLEITGVPDPSLPTGEPAYAACSNEILPFEIGAPLLLVPGGIVPAMTVDLTATADAGAVELAWTADGIDCADRVHVFRTAADGSLERVVALEDGDACGRWTDADAPLDLDGVRYQVTLETGAGALVSPEVTVSDAPDAGRLPSRAQLLPNVPNPFNPATDLRFSLARSGPVRIDLFDTAGRRVRRIDLGEQPAGENFVTWRGQDDAGRPVASGVYLVRLTTEDGIDSQRIVLLK